MLKDHVSDKKKISSKSYINMERDLKCGIFLKDWDIRYMYTTKSQVSCLMTMLVLTLQIQPFHVFTFLRVCVMLFYWIKPMKPNIHIQNRVNKRLGYNRTMNWGFVVLESYTMTSNHLKFLRFIIIRNLPSQFNTTTVIY